MHLGIQFRKTRAINNVAVTRYEKIEYFRYICYMVFEIRILDADDIPARGLNTLANRRPLAGIVLLIYEQGFRFELKTSYDFPGFIAGAVIDENQLFGELKLRIVYGTQKVR